MGYGVLVYTWLEERLAVRRTPRLNLPPPPATMTSTTMIAVIRIVELEVDREGHAWRKGPRGAEEEPNAYEAQRQ